MIPIKSIAQSFVAIATISTFTAGSVYAIKEIKNDSNNFYLVNATAATSQATTDLWSEPTIKASISTQSIFFLTQKQEEDHQNKIQKNYTCLTNESEQKKEDKSCELYSISVSTSTKSLAFAELQQNKTKRKAIKKEELKDGKFFLLKASPSLFSSWTLDGTQNISLASSGKVKSDENKKYATLTIHAKLTKTKLEGKAKMGIIKKTATVETKQETINNNVVITEQLTVSEKCSFSFLTTPIDCSAVYIGSLTGNQELKDLVFTNVKIPIIKEQINLIANHYYFFSLTTNNFDIEKAKSGSLIKFTNSKKTIEVRDFGFASSVFVAFSNGVVEEAIIAY